MSAMPDELGTVAAVGSVAGVPTFTAASRYRLAIGRLRRALEAKR
jgi:hypothetical protein